MLVETFYHQPYDNCLNWGHSILPNLMYLCWGKAHPMPSSYGIQSLGLFPEICIDLKSHTGPTASWELTEVFSGLHHNSPSCFVSYWYLPCLSMDVDPKSPSYLTSCLLFHLSICFSGNPTCSRESPRQDLYREQGVSKFWNNSGSLLVLINENLLEIAMLIHLHIISSYLSATVTEFSICNWVCLATKSKYLSSDPLQTSFTISDTECLKKKRKRNLHR
jgi:hypothetical protein